MKIALTGASGFIGAILADRLWTRRHHLVLLSRNPPPVSNLTQQEWIAWSPGAPGDWEHPVIGKRP
jgi:uncharacterized protein YbjT (DUF2867 family)